jgi:hypothetical protein
MHDIMLYLNDFLRFFENGVREGFAHINAALGLIIALVAAWRLAHWKKIWASALGATLVHLIAVVVIPVLANEATFRLPPDLLTVGYWRTALALYLGYLLVIALFYAIKKNVLPKAAPAAHHH